MYQKKQLKKNNENNNNIIIIAVSKEGRKEGVRLHIALGSITSWKMEKAQVSIKKNDEK